MTRPILATRGTVSREDLPPDVAELLMLALQRRATDALLALIVSRACASRPR